MMRIKFLLKQCDKYWDSMRKMGQRVFQVGGLMFRNIFFKKLTGKRLLIHASALVYLLFLIVSQAVSPTTAYFTDETSFRGEMTAAAFAPKDEEEESDEDQSTEEVVGGESDRDKENGDEINREDTGTEVEEVEEKANGQASEDVEDNSDSSSESEMSDQSDEQGEEVDADN